MTAPQLYHGDCLEIMPTLEAGSVDAIITDLPYGTTACKWDVIIPFEPMWEAARRVLKPNGVFITTASQPFASLLVCSNLDWFKYEFVWKKNRGSRFVHAKNAPIAIHESVLIFSFGKIGHIDLLGRKRMTYNPQGLTIINRIARGDKNSPNDKSGQHYGRPSQKEYVQDKTNYPNSVIEIKSEFRTFHPTQKPVPLYEYLIKTYTNPGEVVLDICMGSGTTGVAAAQTGRQFIGIEKDAEYFALASKRLAEVQPGLFKEEQ